MNTSHLSNQRVIEKCRLLIVLVMNIFLPIPHIKSGYLLWYMLHEENTNKTPTIRPRYRIVQSMNSWPIMKHSKVPAQSDREPVDDLDNRDKAVILGDLKKKLIVPIPMQRKGYSGALRWALSRLGWPCWSSPSLSTAPLAFPKTPSWLSSCSAGCLECPHQDWRASWPWTGWSTRWTTSARLSQTRPLSRWLPTFLKETLQAPKPFTMK